MTRKLVVAVPVISDKQKQSILDAAGAHGFTVDFYPNAAAAVPHVGDAEIILTNQPEPAKHAPRLKWFCTTNAGVDPFLKEGAFASPEAVLTNSSGAYGVTIAEHIIMVTLEVMRREPEYRAIVAERGWKRDLAVRSIKDCRITLLGTGDIGQEAAIRLRAFGPASLTGVNRSGKNPNGLFDEVVPQSELDSVLPRTDLLIISLPGTLETRHMLDQRRLGLLPDGAIIVNVGRGPVIDQQALEAELRSGRLSAALDVFETEPLPPEDSLWTCPNLLITPHTAGNMTLPYTRQRIIDLFLEDFENYCAGRTMARKVDLKKGY